ncbi:hypothetical protein CBE89_01685 [Corynebacterium striatum]|uniref:Heavy-metal chelation domain-containing protein n=1 Tax=Corynebacterium striatum TaxID=43770 RepID=A0A2Z2J1T5_CORST|nr:DUF364 domain-containing protein [Corynebacterium striatum]ART20357.1 hypothetical protein CBE89_01685 [Corynebacterium striatum]HCG2962431.1 DUF364 domain-containing protein [Corynebacterium striatum]
MSAWDLYDELIDAIPLDIQVVKAAQGPQWTRIYTNNPSCGIALTMSTSSRPAQMNHDYAGIPLRAIAQLSKSWNFAEASFGMAALNAFYSTQGVAYNNNFVPTPGEKATWGEVFDPFSEAVLGKKVAVIGHFPFAPKALHNAGEFYMLERHLNEGDFPDSAAEYILPECDYVFISGSAFVNKTAPRLLELSHDSFNVLVGPSTPLAPLLLEDYGVSMVTGMVSERPMGMFEALDSAAFPGMFDNGHRVERRA